jgi:cyclophilin family peptidyl-prolyl cis-trans isomerase
MLKKILYIILIIGFLLLAYFVFNNTAKNTMPQKKTSASTESNKYPFQILDKNKKYQAVMETTEGNIVIDLNVKDTPVTVSNFVSLAKKGFYNDTKFHRVIYNFMIQGGDPNGDGTGGPGYRFADEPVVGEYTRGTIAMANAGPNTNGSQFFIMHTDYNLPKSYVIFGKVVEGIDVVDRLASTPVRPNPMSGEESQPVNPEYVKKITVKEL